jgi:hypothetical protein
MRGTIAKFGPATRWPELAIERSLSYALYTAAANISDGRPSYDAGKTAVRRISAAANMFELMVHQLAEADPAAAETLRSMLGSAAATLRSCLPALVAPTGNTFPPCIRLLSEALAGMAIRDFSWVDKNLVQTAPAIATSWRDRLQAFILYGGSRWLWRLPPGSLSRYDGRCCQIRPPKVLRSRSRSFVSYMARFHLLARPDVTSSKT